MHLSLGAGPVGGLEVGTGDSPGLLHSAAAAVPVCDLEGGTGGVLELLLSRSTDPADGLEVGCQGLLLSEAAGPEGGWEERAGEQGQLLPLHSISIMKKVCNEKICLLK